MTSCITVPTRSWRWSKLRGSKNTSDWLPSLWIKSWLRWSQMMIEFSIDNFCFMKLLPLLFTLGYASIHKIGEDYKISKPEQPHANALVICFMFLSLSIGSLFKEFSKRTGVRIITWIKVPYTPMLFVIGILWGYYSSSLGLIGLCC